MQGIEMAQKPKDATPREFKRLNRAVGAAEALSGVLDPALKRRGFASRDIITHWRAMAPHPYGELAMPDKLAWPRGERSAQGATLYLRCVPGHQLALSHEAPRIAAAVNRYFGYVLVDQVRLATMPLTPGSAAKAKPQAEPDAGRRAEIGEAVGKVEDQRLRDALMQLGLGIVTQKR
jgi:hypothetical protein